MTERDDREPPRRSRAAARVSRIAGLIDAATFFKVREDVPLPGVVTLTFPVARGSFAERKAQADRIAAAIRVKPEWQNGCYVANVPVGKCRFELRFDPPILAACASDGDGAGGAT